MNDSNYRILGPEDVIQAGDLARVNGDYKWFVVNEGAGTLVKDWPYHSFRRPILEPSTAREEKEQPIIQCRNCGAKHEVTATEMAIIGMSEASLRAQLAEAQNEVFVRRKTMADIVRTLGHGAHGLDHQEIVPEIEKLNGQLAEVQRQLDEEKRFRRDVQTYRDKVILERDAALKQVEGLKAILQRLFSYKLDWPDDLETMARSALTPTKEG
jgi:hypothetical protein